MSPERYDFLVHSAERGHIWREAIRDSARVVMQRADPGHVSRSWDDEYRRGRYCGEPPIPFVGRIVDILRDRPEIMRGKGLYVGCGNGRNYIALVDAGLYRRHPGLSSTEQQIRFDRCSRALGSC